MSQIIARQASGTMRECQAVLKGIFPGSAVGQLTDMKRRGA
ncbi:hypothetical protein GCM10028825_18800 [Spirosoma agri]